MIPISSPALCVFYSEPTKCPVCDKKLFKASIEAGGQQFFCTVDSHYIYQQSNESYSDVANLAGFQIIRTFFNYSYSRSDVMSPPTVKVLKKPTYECVLSLTRDNLTFEDFYEIVQRYKKLSCMS